MKKSLLFILMFLFMGFSFSSESPFPKIKKGTYNIEYRKGKTIFVDFLYKVEVQGKDKSYDAWLKVDIYNKKGKEIESFGKEIKIEPDSLQTFYGNRMMLMKIVNEIDKVVFDLGIYQKKY